MKVKESYPVLKEMLTKNLKADAEELVAASEQINMHGDDVAVLSDISEVLKRVENNTRMVRSVLGILNNQSGGY